MKLKELYEGRFSKHELTGLIDTYKKFISDNSNGFGADHEMSVDINGHVLLDEHTAEFSQIKVEFPFKIKYGKKVVFEECDFTEPPLTDDCVLTTALSFYKCDNIKELLDMPVFSGASSFNRTNVSFSNCASLTKIGDVHVRDLTVLKCPNLTSIGDIHSLSVSIAQTNLTELNMPKAQYFKIATSPNFKVKPYPEVEHLVVGKDTKFSDLGNVAKAFPNLRHITIYKADIINKGILQLFRIKDLQTFETTDDSLRLVEELLKKYKPAEREEKIMEILDELIDGGLEAKA